MGVYPRTDFLESKDAQKYPYIYKCDKPGCYFIVSAKTEEQALWDASVHSYRSCPMTGTDALQMEETDARGQHYTVPHRGKTLMEKLFDEADEQFARALEIEGGTAHTPPAAKAFGICRGLAIAIHTFAPEAYYATVDDVVREIVRRNKQAKGEVEWQVTLGYKYNPMPADLLQQKIARGEHPTLGKQSSPSTSTAKKSGKQLNADEVAGITAALQSKLFDVPTLARTYKVPVARIQEIADSAGLT